MSVHTHATHSWLAVVVVQRELYLALDDLILGRNSAAIHRTAKGALVEMMRTLTEKLLQCLGVALLNYAEHIFTQLISAAFFVAGRVVLRCGRALTRYICD